MIISHWSEQFRGRYGGELPDDYMCFDLETTGFSRDKDVIVEWGHCIVRDRKVVNRMNMVLNWLDHEEVPRHYVEQQLARVRRKMNLDGKPYRITPGIMKAEGVEPEKALPFIRDLLKTVQDQGELLVSHNGWNFDVQMLLAHFRDFLYDDEFDFREDGMFDTGAVAKASQMLDRPELLPQAHETMQAYFKRVTGWRAAGVKWNIESCIQQYGLSVASDTLHQAGEDAHVLHLLFEKFRDLAALPVSKRAVALPPERKPAPGARRRRGQRAR